MQGGLPILQRVTAQTQEATLMAVQDGDHQLFVHYVEGPQQLSVFGEPGKLGPLHCTGHGKALVAFAPPEERERLLRELELKPMTPVTIPTGPPSAPRSRRSGPRVGRWPSRSTRRASGVPVLGLDGIAIAAISTAAPGLQGPGAAEMAERYVPPLRAAARELAALLPARG